MPLRIFTATLLALILSSCDSPPPEQSVTATIQIHRPPFAGDNFLAHQINTLKNTYPDLKIRRIEDSDLITFTADHPDQEHAKQAIQSALDSYSDQRSRSDPVQAKAHLQTLQKKIADQRKLVQEKLDYADHHIVPSAIPVVTEFRSEEEILMKARQRLDDFQTQAAQLEVELKKMASLKSDQLVEYAAGLDLPENQVTFYYTKHREAENKRLTQLAKGLAKNHPTVTALEEESAQALTEARLEVISPEGNMQTKLLIFKRQIESMEQTFDDHESGRSAEWHAGMRRRLDIAVEADRELKEARETLELLESQKNQLKKFQLFPNLPFIHLGWDHHSSS